MRFAVVTHYGDALSRVQAYLPANYEAISVNDDTVIIAGEDNAGWTLDGYVIPRLASGLIWAHELVRVNDP